MQTSEVGGDNLEKKDYFKALPTSEIYAPAAFLSPPGLYNALSYCKKAVRMDFEIIETLRLILKGLSPEGMRYIFENHSKEEIKRMLGHHSEEDYQKEEYKHKNGYSCYNRSFRLFLLTDKTSGAVIGRCGIHNWNADHRRAEIGYSMTDERYKRIGLMTEAVGAILEYGFHQMDLHRIEALVGPRNIPSQRIMEKFHFIKEGVLREHYYTDEQFEDSVVFSKLRQEYIDERHEQKL